ncbi:MAG: S49 family peptidase [Marinobacterium sp.]|nr:S49 family peptidase [Marinobacterium sp.]
MKQFPQIAARVLNTPLLLEPAYARVFFSALASRLGISSLADADGQIGVGESLRTLAESYTRTRTDANGYKEIVYQVQRSVAVVPVQGTLVHKSGRLNPYSGMTGYDGILQRTAAALADPKVKAVLLDLNTPGGEVSGCFDTARTLRKMADQAGKPLWAIAFDMNCSAGMALASAAHRRLITSTGNAGSVGVVMAHANYQQQLEDAGVDVTLIHSGAHKVDGNPYGALPPEVLERFQTETDALRTEFAQLIADHTRLNIDAVLATEAAVFRGQAAVEVGFADELVNGNEVIEIFSDHLSSTGSVITTGATMSTQTPAEAATQPTAAATPEPAAQPATTPAATSDSQTERTRIAGILGHAHAEGRGKLANHLAFNTSLSVDEAAAILAQAEAERDSANMATALDSMMQGQNTEVGADMTDDTTENDTAARAIGAWKAATGAA